MALRLIEIYLPADRAEEARSLLGEHFGSDDIEAWFQTAGDERALVRVLVSAEEVQEILDALQRSFESVAGFRAFLLPVEATVPRLDREEEAEEEEAAADEGEVEGEERRAGGLGISVSREELYADVTDNVELSPMFLLLVALSSVVAAIGLVRDNVAVVIGAMVIAPLLGPNVALSLATTLGDVRLARRALKVNAAGMGLALALAIAIGLAISVPPDITEISLRTGAGLGDIVLALASGAAGVLTFTAGLPTALVGVMVAVALLPPAVVAGMLLGAGQLLPAMSAALLLLTNVICVNLAGVLVFLLQGVRPMHWWEADRARRATRRALALWVLLLALLIAAIYLSPGSA